MEVEKRSSKGGFLQLFDWNVKSRKKLFSSKSDLPGTSNHGKENLDNLAISRLQQMKLHENIHGPSLRGSDYASSVNNDEGFGTKAPGVVARLMGLDSLPTSDVSEPSFTPFIDSQAFRHAHHSRITNEFESEHHSMDYGMRNKLDGFSRNSVEDRLLKLQNRPIERFQTEMLPPKSAKSIPITHHRLLSPIKSPGFMLTRNAACIMEAASKIIEQSPHSTLNGRLQTFGSSPAPLRIRNLKEKMEAAHRTSEFPEACQRTKEQTSVKSISQPHDKRQSGPEIMLGKQVATGSLKSKNKSVSLATQAKANLQKGDGTTSRNSRNIMNQKEDVDVKPAQIDKKQRNSPRSVQNRSSTTRSSEVLRQNNQKQNFASTKDRPSLKPRVPYQQDKGNSTNVSSRETKTSKKAVENSAGGNRKVHLVPAENGKELSSSRTKNFSGKKRPIDGNTISEGTAANHVVVKEKERSVKCNVTIGGSLNWDSIDRKNGMDVVSFTFTSPIKKSVPESERSAKSVTKARSLFLDLQDDQPYLGTSDLPSSGIPVIDSDALSVLLEEKLKELSSRVETSQAAILKGGSPPSSASLIPDSVPSSDAVNSLSTNHDNRFYLGIKDQSVSQHDFDDSSVDWLLVKRAELKPQGVELMEGVMEFNSSRRENSECGIELDCQIPHTAPDLEPSLSEGSCMTSDSTATLTSNGSKQCSSSELIIDLSSSISAKNIEVFEGEVELQDSASSMPLEGRKLGTTFEFTSVARSSHWKLEYIKEVLSSAELALEDFVLTGKAIDVNLFDLLESQKVGLDKDMEDFFKLERKVLFDCVSMCLEDRRRRALGGSCKEWAKLSTMFQRKELLADELYKEISGWTSMEDLMVDELVDKDMSTGYGKWLDFEAEALEEGVVIQNGILTSLIDDILADFLFS